MMIITAQPSKIEVSGPWTSAVPMSKLVPVEHASCQSLATICALSYDFPGRGTGAAESNEVESSASTSEEVEAPVGTGTIHVDGHVG